MYSLLHRSDSGAQRLEGEVKSLKDKLSKSEAAKQKQDQTVKNLKDVCIHILYQWGQKVTRNVHVIDHVVVFVECSHTHLQVHGSWSVV